MKKKLVSIAMALVLAASVLAGCGSQQGSGTSAAGAAAQESSAAVSAPEAASTAETAAAAPEAAQEPEQTAAAPEAEERQAASPSSGAVKVVKNSRVTKSMLEDLFEDDSDAADDDDDSDFEVTDFRDV